MYLLGATRGEFNSPTESAPEVTYEMKLLPIQLAPHRLQDLSVAAFFASRAGSWAKNSDLQFSDVIPNPFVKTPL
ncbi:hypothetical protein [Moorena sp. SIO3I8]|uniref:hypothetical protein n=1 Tax=Moorena sp. SIO3I8 TaxID=2607833 RepID=UPI0025F95192|nr:hypothetical protein [Moorena sp. SIO3I8]